MIGWLELAATVTIIAAVIFVIRQWDKNGKA